MLVLKEFLCQSLFSDFSFIQSGRVTSVRSLWRATGRGWPQKQGRSWPLSLAFNWMTTIFTYLQTISLTHRLSILFLMPSCLMCELMFGGKWVENSLYISLLPFSPSYCPLFLPFVQSSFCITTPSFCFLSPSPHLGSTWIVFKVYSFHPFLPLVNERSGRPNTQV